MSLSELAEKMKISKGNICDIENGRRDPRFTTLLAIAKGLEVSLKKLFN